MAKWLLTEDIGLNLVIRFGPIVLLMPPRLSPEWFKNIGGLSEESNLNKPLSRNFQH